MRRPNQMPEWVERNNLCLRCEKLPEFRCGFEQCRTTNTRTGYIVTVACNGFLAKQATPAAPTQKEGDPTP